MEFNSRTGSWVNLNTLSIDLLSRILNHVSFLDRLNLRAVSKALERVLRECDLEVERDRSRVDLSIYGRRLSIKIGRSRPFHYALEGVPDPTRLFAKIHAKELRIVVQDCDSRIFDFYDAFAAKCSFSLLHLTIFHGSPRICDLIRAHSEKEMYIVFQGNDIVDLEMLKLLQRSATLYLHKEMRLTAAQVRELIGKGHSLELVRCEDEPKELLTEIVETLSRSQTSQLVSLDIPLENFSSKFDPLRSLGIEGGGTWTFEGQVVDKLAEQREWRRGGIRLIESRQRLYEDDPTFVASTWLRVVISNCERNSEAGIYYPHPNLEEDQTMSEFVYWHARYYCRLLSRSITRAIGF